MRTQRPELLDECIQRRFQFFDGGLVFVGTAKQSHDFNRGAELVKRLDLEDAWRFDGFDSFVGIFFQGAKGDILLIR